MHSKAERDRTHWSRRLRTPRASGRSSFIHPPPTSSVVAQSANQVLSEVLSDPPSFVVRIA